MQPGDIAYRAAFDTAGLELNLIQMAMAKLQREREQIENAVPINPGIAKAVIFASTDLSASID